MSRALLRACLFTLLLPTVANAECSYTLRRLDGRGSNTYKHPDLTVCNRELEAGRGRCRAFGKIDCTDIIKAKCVCDGQSGGESGEGGSQGSGQGSNLQQAVTNVTAEGLTNTIMKGKFEVSEQTLSQMDGKQLGQQLGNQMVDAFFGGGKQKRNEETAARRAQAQQELLERQERDRQRRQAEQEKREAEARQRAAEEERKRQALEAAKQELQAEWKDDSGGQAAAAPEAGGDEDGFKWDEPATVKTGPGTSVRYGPAMKKVIGNPRQKEGRYVEAGPPGGGATEEAPADVDGFKWEEPAPKRQPAPPSQAAPGAQAGGEEKKGTGKEAEGTETVDKPFGTGAVDKDQFLKDEGFQAGGGRSGGQLPKGAVLTGGPAATGGSKVGEMVEISKDEAIVDGVHVKREPDGLGGHKWVPVPEGRPEEENAELRKAFSRANACAKGQLAAARKGQPGQIASCDIDFPSIQGTETEQSKRRRQQDAYKRMQEKVKAYALAVAKQIQELKAQIEAAKKRREEEKAKKAALPPIATAPETKPEAPAKDEPKQDEKPAAPEPEDDLDALLNEAQNKVDETKDVEQRLEKWNADCNKTPPDCPDFKP